MHLARQMRSLHKLAVGMLVAAASARVAFACPLGPSVATVELASESSQIDSFCDELRTFAKSKPARIFAAFSKNGEPVSWKEYDDGHVVQRRLRSLIGKYIVAEVWTREDHAMLVETTSSGDTGDWLHLVRYCYRPDGGLAKTDFSMSSFVEDGGISATR